jgi:hypothetical protein
MTPKAANSKTDALTTTSTTEYQELTPNELATIHGGKPATGQKFLVVNMSDCMISSYSIGSTTSQPQ